MKQRTPIPKRSKPRREPMRDAKYLAWIRKLPCVACNCFDDYGSEHSWRYFSGLIWNRLQTTRTEAAHIGSRGLAQKCSDRETIPLCAGHHREDPVSHHRLGKRFFTHHGIDRDALIEELQKRYEEQHGN